MAHPGLRRYRATLDLVELVETNLIDSTEFSLRGQYREIDELKASILSQGLLQPLLLRPTPAGFQLVSGHRRFEACRRLRWSRIPCIVKELSEREAYEVALIENLQRSSLDPIEEASAFKHYVLDYGWGGVSELAGRIGKSEEYVSHRIGLLKLPSDVLDRISRHRLSASVANELTSLTDPALQARLGALADENHLSVKRTRDAVKRAKKGVPDYEDVLTVNDFQSYGGGTRPEVEDSCVKRTTTTLRMCMIRLDALLQELAEGEEKEMVREVRFEVHRLVDKTIKFGRKRRTCSPTPSRRPELRSGPLPGR